VNCTGCGKWTDEPSGNGRCRGCYDYANARFPGINVHPSNTPNVVDLLEDRVRELEAFVRRCAEGDHPDEIPEEAAALLASGEKGPVTK
jgi:hypothetical protein